MIHKACMPVYMNSGKNVAGRVDGDSKVLQEVLAELKTGATFKRAVFVSYRSLQNFELENLLSNFFQNILLNS